MIGISPAIRQKTTFGAADVAPISQPIVASPVSNSPIQEKHGYLEQDLYGERSHNRDVTLSPEYSHYANPKQHHNSLGIVKTIATVALVGTGIFFAIKKRGAIKEFGSKVFSKIKNIFSKSDATAVKKGKKGTHPPDIIELSEFQKKMKTVIASAKQGKYKDIPQEDFRIIFGLDENTKNKRKALEDLYTLAKIYGQKDRQARVLIMMPQALEDDASHIIDMFALNRIDEVDSKLISRIEGFQILNAGRDKLSESSDMIVDSKVGHGVNAGKAGDVGSKWGRNIRQFFKDLF